MKKEFKMPTKSNLKNRSSTINNAFAISITPYITPNNSELKSYYEELKIEPGQCGYCMRLGEGKTVDHINPLVENKMPSGYITDINNLIPCCKDCNSKKGGKSFEYWYKEKNNVLRLKQHGLTEEQINERYNIISKYIENHCTHYEYSEIVGEELWEDYKRRQEELRDLLKKNQEFCDYLNKKISDYVKNQKNSKK